MGVTELADEMEMSKSAVHKHLQTLVADNYVKNEDGRYELGFKFLTIGGQIRDQDLLCQFARSAVRKLDNQTDQNTAFVVREGEYGIFACVSSDRYGLRETVPLGNRYPLHQNASGKAILRRCRTRRSNKSSMQPELPQKRRTRSLIERPCLTN